MSADKAKLKLKFTRRDALKVLGSGAAALVAAEQLDSVDISGSGSANSADVGVVGAGFAGLSAARMLMRQGKKVAVLVSVTFTRAPGSPLMRSCPSRRPASLSPPPHPIDYE